MFNPYNIPKAPLDMEKVSSKFNMEVAYRLARRRKGHYRQVKSFDKNRDENIEQLCIEAKTGTFRSSAYIHKTITDGRKERVIAKSSKFRDRVFQWGVMYVWIDSLLPIFSEKSHASTPKRGIHSAMQMIIRIISDEKNVYCLQIDVRKFFPSVDRTILKEIVSYAVGEDNIVAIEILNRIIDDAPDTGIPIGNLLSQYFANLYLTPFDIWVEDYTDTENRYMDDILLFGENSEVLHRLFREVEWYLKSVLNLDIKPNWQIFPVASRGIDFVGYRIFPDGRVIMRKDTFLKMRRKLKKILVKAQTYGSISERDRSTVFSYFGWVVHCSFKAKMKMYHDIFKPIFDAAHIELKKKTKRKLWSK